MREGEREEIELGELWGWARDCSKNTHAQHTLCNGSETLTTTKPIMMNDSEDKIVPKMIITH